MQLGLAIAVALLIVAVVAWPLVVRRRDAARGTQTTDPPAGTDHGAALNDVYEAIRTLQTEHGLGRINDDDYQGQLDEYRRQAARIMRDMDRGSGKG